MTYDPTTPPWKQKPPQTRQIKTRAREENLSHSRFSPLCPYLKKKSNTGYTAPQPHPTHSSVYGTPLCKGWPQGSFPLLFLHFGLLLATPCPFPSFGLRPITPTSSTYSNLLSSLGPPYPRASGEAASQASSLPQQGAPPGPLCLAYGIHTAAPLSLRSGAERCRLIRGGVVYGG